MRVLVIGLAVSGRAAASALQSHGETVVGYDARPDAAEGVALDDAHLGEWDRRLLHGVDLVVPSPGVAETSRIMADVLAAGVGVWSELELGARYLEGTPMAAITGTNGKTTVTEIAAAMLVESGVDAAAVGNIGDPISASGGRDALVVEASSFQLRFIDRFEPEAAVIVNFAPDHLDWHPDVAAYGAAKTRIFENMAPDAPVVFDAEDAGAAALVSSSASRRVGVSGSARLTASGRSGERLHLGDAVIAIGDLQRRDPTMLVDLAAAAEAALALGATTEGVAAAAVSYAPGKHRREIVAASGGVTFVDDSKATNPHAALAAIAAYPSVVLIAGGKAKGLDISPLARAESVRHLIAIGEGAADLVAARPDAITAETMDEAVERAIAASHPGDVVLLSPGCASFDMFDSYGHRGEVFATAVRQRVGG